MKIRTDFVTNSSSSSFVTINIKTKDGNFKLKEDEFIGCIELVNNMDNEALAFVIRCAFGYNDYLSKDAVALIENIKKIDMKTVEFIELQEVYDDYGSEGDGRTAYKHFYSGITGQWYDTKKELNCEEKKFFSEKEKYRNVEFVGTGKDGRAPNHEYMSVGDSEELVREPDKHFYSEITGQWYDTKKELNCEEKKFFSEKEKYRNVELVGTGKDGRAPNHEYMSVGDSVELVREPDNPFDANAVLVKGKGRGLGHISAYLAKNISRKLDTGKFIVDNAKVSSATPLSQRSKLAKNPIMEIDFDIIPVDSETKTDSQKNITKSAQQKKSTSAKRKNKTNSKPSDKNKQLSIEQIKESVLTEVFETIVDEFDESDDVKQSVKEHFYHNFYGCIFLLLFLQFGVNESELDAQELSEIIISEEFRSVLGVTTIEVEIMIEIKSIMEKLLENGDEEDLAETILSSNIVIATMENEMYQNFTYDLERVCPKLSVGMGVMRNQLEEFEQQIKGMISNVLSDLGYTDEDDEDDEDDDFDPVAVEQAKAEIVDSLDEIKKIANELDEGLTESKSVLSKYGDYLEKRTAKEKAAEEEKILKKAEAMAKGKSEKDIVNMFVILTNEKKLGHLHRNQDEFFEIYEDDFAALSKLDVVKLRKDMLVEMEDESLCAYYAERFKQRTVKDRFYISTMNLNNVSEGSDFDKIAEWSIEMSKEWYVPTEYAEVRNLMDLELENTREQISDNYKVADEGWIHFSTAKDSLQLVITNEANDTSNQPDFSNFQIGVGSQFVTVRLATRSMIRMSIIVSNYMPWYWGVSIRDIWEAAFKNDIYDEREGANNKTQIANKAITQIRSMYQDVNVMCDSNLGNSKSTPILPEKVIEPINGTVPIDGGELEIKNGTLKKIKGKTKNVIVPKGVVKISASAFKNRQSIERVEIPEGVTEIKDGTFELCSNLKEIKLPSTVSVIGKDVFRGCYKIEKFEIPSDNEYFKMIGDCLVDLKRQAIIKGVGDRLPKDGIKEISCDAFSHCEKCREIVIPKGTETIFSHAFYDCDNITKIIIPESVSLIASSAFVYISKDVTFVVDEGNKYYSIVGNCLVDKRNKVLLAGSGFINIPDDGCVTEIASFAIRDFSNDELVIPASIESLDIFSIDISDDITKTIIFENPHVNIENGAIDCYDEAKPVIVGHRGSSAEKYAKDNDFCFKTLGSASEEETARITSASTKETKTGGVNGNSSKPTQPSKPQSPAKANNGTVSTPPPVAEKTAEQPKKSGCYVATAVYGSYDCPEVWTLRRFRDYSLAATLLGRLFIMFYYAISPTLVKWFGNTKWFKKIWKAVLDKMVDKLQQKGFKDTPYQD